MAKKKLTAADLANKLVEDGHPTKIVRGKKKLRAPDGLPSSQWKAWRAAKAAERRPAGVE